MATPISALAAATRVVEKLARRWAGVPLGAAGAEDAADQSALHAALRAQRDVGVVRGLCDADERVGGGDAALGGGDVWTALQQLRRKAGGDGGRIAGEWLLGDVEGGCGFADQDGDGVLILRAVHAKIDKLCAGFFELRLGLGDIALGAEAALEANLREVERLGVGVDGGAQQLRL